MAHTRADMCTHGPTLTQNLPAKVLLKMKVSASCRLLPDLVAVPLWTVLSRRAKQEPGFLCLLPGPHLEHWVQILILPPETA